MDKYNRLIIYLIMKNIDPNVYRRANFLAFNIKTGKNKNERKKHNNPNIIQEAKPIILCVLV